MKKRQFLLLALCFFCALALIAGARWSLQQSRALVWRATPLLTLTPTQERQLDSLRQTPLTLEVFTRGNPQLRRSISDVVRPWQVRLPLLRLQFINPDTDPVRVQQRAITREGQMYLTNGQRGERIDIVAPRTLVAALLDFTHTGESNIIHLQGHGERAFLSDSAGSWQGLYDHLRNAKTHITDLEQNLIPAIPRNTDLLVIADPVAISTADSSALQTYLALGGNLLYTTDTAHPYFPSWLARLTGLKLVSGVMVDAGAKQYGLNDPQMLLIDNLGNHPINRGLKNSPLLPTAVAFVDNPAEPPTSDWHRQPLLWSGAKSWAEQGNVHAATLRADAGEMRGPLPVGWILERQIQHKKQVIVILGDSDMFQGNYFSVAGNSAWILRLFAYLLPAGANSTLAAPTLPDQFITLPENEKMPLAVTLLFVLPLLALGAGVALSWWRRKSCR